MRTLVPTVPTLLLAACTAGPTDTSDTSDTSDTGVQPCTWSTTSTLPGASLAGGEADCGWSLADADAGVDVPWTLTVTEPHDVAVDMVSCVDVDASGLRFREYVSADAAGTDADTWCPRCDVGICPVDEDTYTTVVGEWPATFTWRPRRWAGPSDYGAEPGALFPAGTYALVVRAAGTLVADGTPWEVTLSTEVTLTE